jgi:hypothetical protein
MCSVIVAAEESLPEEMIRPLHQIRDDSNTPLKDRILLILRSLLDDITALKSEVVALGDQREDVDRAQRQYQHKCVQLLSLFEEELGFLQSLTHSSDLQAAVFAHTARHPDEPLLNETSKSELIRRCALMGRFIEETMGTITPDNFESVVPTRTFELLQSSTLEDRLKSILSRFDGIQDLDARELVDILVAQVFISELLKTHISEMHARITHCSHELAALRQQIDDQSDHTEQIETLEQAVKHFQHRENKLKRYLEHYIELEDGQTPLAMVKRFVEIVNEQISTKSVGVGDSGILAQKDDEIRALQEKLEAEHTVNESNRIARVQDMDRQTAELQSQLRDVRAKFDEVARQNDENVSQTQSLRRALDEKDGIVKNEIGRAHV